VNGPIGKALIFVVWLGAAAACDFSPKTRRVMAYAGAVVALVHVFAFVGAKVEGALRTPSRDGMNAPILGFFAGILVGGLAGVPLGAVAAKNRMVYAAAHLVAALFLALLPLFRL
jgi:hypothetical protein